MAPPVKRRKRNFLPSSSPPTSDDEDQELMTQKAGKDRSSNLASSSASSSEKQVTASENGPGHSTNAKQQPRVDTASHPHNAAPVHLPKPGRLASKSASNSPEKTKRKGRTEDKVKSGDIFTFFTKQAQRQQAEGTGSRAAAKPRVTPQSSKDSKVEDDDIISDGEVVENKSQRDSMVGQAARKRARGTDTFKNEEGGVPSASQKFVMKPMTLGKIKDEDDMRPWAERFAPVNLDELAVHKKKVGDVRTWLEDVMNGKMRQRLLLLKGAAGTGKTTTLQLLANAMDCDVLEWRNPIGSVATSDGFQSISAQFEEFMGRGGRFGQLDILSESGVAPSKPVIKPLDRRKQIIMVEEFPNTFTRSSTALQSFRSSILQYLASNTPTLSMTYYGNVGKDPIIPVVLIVSETLLTTTSASADSFTAHRLLGPEILQHPGVGVIEFNAIAPTLLAKALEVVVQKESRKSGRRKTPGPLVLKKLGEIGDVRSAIGSLEFLCLRGDVDGDWGARISFAKAKKSNKNAALTKMEAESLELITRREASLGIFHAVGKVVYNKRDEAPSSVPPAEDVEQLSDFLSSKSRPKRSQVFVDELIDETGTDTQTFIAALHENYLLSCDACPTSFEFSSLDHVNGCIDVLSDSDLLCPSWDGYSNSSGFGGGAGGRGTGGDIMRQDEISFQIAVRGILFFLPFPVKRKAPAAGGFRTGKEGDAFKMFYPTSLKLWRMREEIESTVDLWVTRLMRGEDERLNAVTAGAAIFPKPKIGTVESWKNSRAPNPLYAKRTNKEADAAPLMAVGTSARKEMLLERLPYMVLIARAGQTTSALVLRDMEKVTVLSGIGQTSEESLDDGDDATAVGEEWATDKPVEGKSPSKRRLVIRGRGTTSVLPLQQQEQKLVLSDDDIEDD
jgi:cell cycle checkpoint protein